MKRRKREFDRYGAIIKAELNKRGMKQKFISKEIGVTEAMFSQMLRGRGFSVKMVRRKTLEYLKIDFENKR